MVRAYLRHIAALGRPIILGPWRSEIGFEVLYWQPFLNWALKYAGIPPERCIALSRGGMGMLYPAEKHIDLYTLRGVDGVRQQNQVDWEETRMLKQHAVTDWDREVCKDAAQRFGVGKYSVLHPSWMYWLFDPFWMEQASFTFLGQHMKVQPLPVPDLPNGAPMPPQFVAVRFYERATFPFTEDTVSFAKEVVGRIAAQVPVILLNQRIFADDHTDLPIEGPNILHIDGTQEEENLAVQAAILGRASAFVGTYGGVAQWALRHGKPSLSFYTSFSGTAPAHLALSQRIAMSQKVPFEAMSLRGRQLWETALGSVVPVKVEQPKEAA